MVRKKLSDKENELNLSNLKATLAMEDLYLTDDEIEVLRKYSKGIYREGEVRKIFKI